MSFADRYLKLQSGKFYFEAPPINALDILVVIPCCDEPDLKNTLQGLALCEVERLQVGIVVVVNHSEAAPEHVVAQNLNTLAQIASLTANLPQNVNLWTIDASSLPRKHAGAGWARKIGMDWAVSHFNQHKNNNGIIVSLDADSLVEDNYFEVIASFFDKHLDHVAATVYFEHDIEGNEFPADHYNAICWYELYMRYYKHALQFASFPHAIYTLGSAFAVRAYAYAQMGGMNRRQAGEDFYFLHKMAQFGAIGEIANTTVRPSVRASNRVPFGTGAAMKKWLDGSRELELTYSFSLFETIKAVFGRIDEIYCNRCICLDESVLGYSLFNQFAESSGVNNSIALLVDNCGSALVFEKRFFHLFNAFMVLKWLNFAVENGVKKEPLVESSSELLTAKGIEANVDELSTKVLLNLFRVLDKCNNK